MVPRLIMMSVNERAGPPLSTSYSKVTNNSVILWSLMGTRRSLMGPGGILVNHMRSLLFPKLLISLINP